MQKESTLISVDILGSNVAAQLESSEKTAQYLCDYYDLVAEKISIYGWRIVKTMGDCVLISAESNATVDNINALFGALKSDYDIRLCHRECVFEELEVSFEKYSCVDIFGKEVNNLFMKDALTMRLS